MTTPMPDPIPLEMPSGDVDAITALARDIGSAARCLAAVDARICGPAGEAPGWLGDDASAAAAQVTEVDTLVRAAYDAMTPAAERLAAHAERLLEARSRVRALTHEQEEQFAEAWRRWGQVQGLQLQVMTSGPDVQAIVGDLEAAEASRRRRHAVLIEEIEDDAAATARVLVDSCAAVGGRGRPGGASSVIAYLTARLPGWGDRELIRRARALVSSWSDLQLSPERREELARNALPFAGSPDFARALLGALGTDGMRCTFQRLGDGLFGATSSLARLIAQVLGAAARAGAGSDQVEAVLTDEYVPAADPGRLHDLTALGMGTVLAASAALGPGGLEKATVVEWGRQIAAREHRLRAAALDRIDPTDRAAAPVDPLSAVVTVLADGRDPASAAAFLATPSVFDVLLSRTWPDGGRSLGQIIRTAAQVPGAAGDAVARDGLEALGTGLRSGDVHDWPVPPATAKAVSPALADAVALHVSDAAAALLGGADGAAAPADGDMLRGLACLTMDRQAAAVVEEALHRWAAVQPAPFSVAGAVPQFPEIVIPNAYLALQEYGQELGYARHEADLQKQAENRAFVYDMTVGLAVGLIAGPWGLAAGVVADYVAMGLHLDGTWEPGPGQELRYAPKAFDPTTLKDLRPEDWMYAYAMGHMAQDAYDGTSRALGTLDVAVPRPTHWWEPLTNVVKVGPGDLVGIAGHGRVPVH